MTAIRHGLIFLRFQDEPLLLIVGMHHGACVPNASIMSGCTRVQPYNEDDV